MHMNFDLMPLNMCFKYIGTCGNRTLA